MSQHGRYYLGRVIKLGQLNQKTLIEAIGNAASVTVGKFTWTITDVEDKTAPTKNTSTALCQNILAKAT